MRLSGLTCNAANGDLSIIWMSALVLCGLPRPVRKGFAFPSVSLIYCGEAEPRRRKWGVSVGKAEPYRTGRGKAAVDTPD